MKSLAIRTIRENKYGKIESKKWVTTITIILCWTVFAISMMGAIKLLPQKFAWSVLGPIGGTVSLLNGLSTIRRNRIAGVIILLLTIIIFFGSAYIIKVELFIKN